MSIDLYCELHPQIADCHPIKIEQWLEWFEVWKAYLSSEQAIADGEYELSLVITNDLSIQQLNQQYRHIDQPTDVLSFAALESHIPKMSISIADYVEPTYLGDIIISQTTAMRQASERDHSLIYELAWLAAHGFLHLLGWDHPDEASLASMWKQQDIMLQLIALSD